MSRPCAQLTTKQCEEIASARRAMEIGVERYRRAVLRALRDGASFSEVSKATGLSTNTLQRWKREAK